ncbi:MAG: hypothetical protein IKZ75_02335 [Oscillospiraceae bacterium]|nr:hypothetical protein [Oscillospiraceae bacterium]
MRKALKIFGVIACLACVAAIVFGIGLYCVNTFSFGGRSAELMRLEPMYYYYEPLVDDYVSSLVAGKPVTALSCIEPHLLTYYSAIYKTNSDIVMTLDDLYAEDGYKEVTEWKIHHTIEWDPDVYSDALDKLGTTADRGIDLYVMLKRDGSPDEMTYVYEVIQRDSFWYLLSVTEDGSQNTSE